MKKILTLSFFMAVVSSVVAQIKFRVHLDSNAAKTFTGRLFVYTTTDTAKGVPDQPNYKQPMFALNVSDWKPGESREVGDNAEAYSVKPSAMKPGFYKAVAVLDGNLNQRGSFNPGNYYSQNVLFEVKNTSGIVDIRLNRPINERPFRESDTLKLLKLKSDLLSSFHHQDVYVIGGVILPKEYNENQDKKFPIVYIIPGWGGTHYDAMGSGTRKRFSFEKGEPKIYVLLNPETQTRWGLHAFVDSKVNGPWGKALVEEVLPYMRNNYRVTEDANKTFVIGQSSGGYPALWLLLHYPKAFGGSWAVSPDPVDFSSFVGIDLYSPKANFYTDEKGDTLGFFLNNGKFEMTMHEAIRQEMFEGDGGQFQSFEAEFGSLAENGKPKQLFDRKTGAVNKQVADEWKEYDMALYLQKNWKTLQKDLKGKIHVFAGADDNFFLNKAVEAFKIKALKAGVDATIQIVPGANHFNVWTSPDFIERMHKEMDKK
jgi:S-formylglutathione hydrolase FrmB